MVPVRNDLSSLAGNAVMSVVNWEPTPAFPKRVRPLTAVRIASWDTWLVRIVRAQPIRTSQLLRSSHYEQCRDKGLCGQDFATGGIQKGLECWVGPEAELSP